jgi:hypothetical protein
LYLSCNGVVLFFFPNEILNISVDWISWWSSANTQHRSNNQSKSKRAKRVVPIWTEEWYQRWHQTVTESRRCMVSVKWLVRSALCWGLACRCLCQLHTRYNVEYVSASETIEFMTHETCMIETFSMHRSLFTQISWAQVKVVCRSRSTREGRSFHEFRKVDWRHTHKNKTQATFSWLWCSQGCLKVNAMLKVKVI